MPYSKEELDGVFRELKELNEKGFTLEEVERKHIVDVLNETRWRINGPKGAAKILGLHPSTLRSRIKKLGI